ncbi:uncharacterized protein EAF01_008408 [Botrytis porri]|uniref:Uncharacterized protein n=1 Tax=Botrytis porri TaxID=87229 RepID=A0A4Z1KXA8_9HELO|nr:uncharacterized protein EAF01_008408 [Botrytis porri]KAF7899195.1 hypothetical protein EAF01_008408 [Botrytis porri]TGO89225.1 hypothetical protein BPOR_0119g00120 [Botrytis porri]
MPLLEDESIVAENDEMTSENVKHVKLSDRDKARQKRQKKREKRKEEVLLIVYGIRTTETEQTEADEKYGNFPCAQPSPLRKCWTLVEEGSEIREGKGESEGSD